MGIASTTALSLLVIVFTATAQDCILIIENKCSEMVRVGRTGGQWTNENRTEYPITGCPPSQTLNPNNLHCYWDLPSPDGGPCHGRRKIYDLIKGLDSPFHIQLKEVLCGVETFGGQLAVTKVEVYVKL